MPKSVSRRELVRRFKVLGFSGPAQGAKHSFMVRGNLKVRLPNPHGADVSSGLLSEILRQAGINAKVWNGTAE